jgi:hypothetical protein
MESGQAALGGTWIITIFMVIIVSWIVFKYLVPGNFKEWSNFGLIQAFIIALYAEMYGPNPGIVPVDCRCLLYPFPKGGKGHD